MLREKQLLLFVVNPIAGGMKKDDICELIKEYCATNNISSSFYFTTGENDRYKIEEKLKKEKFHAVIAVGGDGTVNMVASLLVNSDIVLGIIPLGSGNGMAKDLEIPLEVADALDLLRDCQAAPIDVLEVNGYYFIHLCDLGFNARIVERFARNGTRGLAAYTRIAFEEFGDYQPTGFRIETDQDSQVFEGKAFMVTVANARQFGTRLKINPGGDVADGKFEILIIDPFPKMASPGLFVSMLFENIDDTDYTHVLHVTRATIWNEDDAPLHIDGEPRKFEKKLDFSILPSSLDIIYPQEKVRELLNQK